MPGEIFDGLRPSCSLLHRRTGAATVLSDFGADVIKIEPPGAGDPGRNLARLPGTPKGDHNYSWLLDNRNKRSTALDLAKPEGQAVLRRLAQRADVFVTSYPLAVRNKLALGYEQLAAGLGEAVLVPGYSKVGDENRNSST